MNANELLKRLIASGADESGILDRFGDNADLYERCFMDFMEDPGINALRDAIKTQNYKQAFLAAHALKGLSGNLGITDFYQAIRILTDSLRNMQYDGIDEEYAQVERQYGILKSTISEEPPAKQEIVSEEPPRGSNKHALCSRIYSLIKDKSKQLPLMLMCITIAVIAAIGLLLLEMNRSHSGKVMEESGQHLKEISNQIKLYIEDNIDIDWRIAQSVGDSILGSAFDDDDPAVYQMLQNKQMVWGVSDLMLYTENGYCIHTDGSAEVNDIASLTVYHAREQGRYLSIVESRLIFTVPVDTTLTFHGSRIMAVSVVRDITSFLDEMNFSSFGEAAWMYLTDKNGVVLSSLSRSSEVYAYNVRAVIQTMEITPLDKAAAPDDFLGNPETSVFLLSDDSRNLYGVSAPIFTNDEPMSLFYFVPQNVVNNVMSGFSQQLMTLSMIIVTLFAAVAVAVFMFMYKSRKKTFDSAILAREQMFDLLIKNAKTAFGLFTTSNSRPDYQSANAAALIGDAYWVLEKTDTGYRIHNDKLTETDNITHVNEALQGWDGRSTFHSGYLCNTQSETPAYFVFELYPVDGGDSSFVGIVQDVTPIYIREEAVKNAMEIAKQASDAKTRFLSSMSHDIRTPMNAIMNMSSFALESIDQPKKLSNYLRIIHESAEHLLHLINDVLDMSRIESGQLILSADPFDIREEIQRQTEIIRPMCSAKNLTLITDFSGLEKTIVIGDALKFSQIVINLLSNAVKFTPEKGAVRFVAKEIPSIREDIVTVRFTVEDNGIGISNAEIDKIFEPFHRSNDKTVGKIEGTGLGLAIVKNYINIMGGNIHCESEYGEGSTFTVELNFPKADTLISNSNPYTVSTNDTFLGMHALVAEDNHTNQVIAKEILERMGFILDFADDGSAAVQEFCKSKPGTYDIIYMDIQMPVMDGYEATVQIRLSNHPQARTIPIIAMTANAFSEDVEKARVTGMDGFVDKPIVSFKLAEQTRIALQNKRGVTK